MQSFYEFMSKDVKTATVIDSVSTHDKLCNKLYAMNLDARDISYER